MYTWVYPHDQNAASLVMGKTRGKGSSGSRNSMGKAQSGELLHSED